MPALRAAAAGPLLLLSPELRRVPFHVVCPSAQSAAGHSELGLFATAAPVAPSDTLETSTQGLHDRLVERRRNGLAELSGAATALNSNS